MCKYLIHYFSGTGNTYHLVKTIEKELADRGNEINILNIEKCKDINLEEYKMHIFCFPVYGFGTPSIMLKHITRLKAVEGCNAAIVCTSAGAIGQSLIQSKYLLKKKGFNVFFIDNVIYTYNFTQVLNPQSKEQEGKVFKAAEAYIKDLIEKVVNNHNNYIKRNFIFLTFAWIVSKLFSNLARRILGKTFIADDACNSCGKCTTACPVKAIYMHHGKPKWKSNCESCQRCINICPQKSIQLSVMKLVIFAIFELAPVLIIKLINDHIASFNFIINILLFIIMFLANTVIADVVIKLMEKSTLLRKLLQINYTKSFRRNLAAGFDIKFLF